MIVFGEAYCRKPFSAIAMDTHMYLIRQCLAQSTSILRQAMRLPVFE